MCFLEPKIPYFTFCMFLHLRLRGHSDVFSVLFCLLGFFWKICLVSCLSGYLGPASTVCIVNNMTCEARPTDNFPAHVQRVSDAKENRKYPDVVSQLETKQTFGKPTDETDRNRQKQTNNKHCRASRMKAPKNDLRRNFPQLSAGGHDLRLRLSEADAMSRVSGCRSVK